jgi:hypothetical protein
MWISGLRGAMAYALALDSTKIANGKINESGQIMLLLTILYSLFTILGVSSILYPILKRCNVN